VLSEQPAAEPIAAVAATTSTLASFASGLEVSHIPAGPRERARDLVLDALASALAGNEASETQGVLAFAQALGASDESSVIGGQRMSPAGATIANAYLITAVTVCDIHRPTTCHVTPEVIGAALVAAEREHVDGATFLAAVVAGLEVTTSVGLGLDPPVFRARQWHMPGISGPFGAAAAVGRILGLDADRLNDAFGIAGSQAAGTYVHLGTPTMKFHQARGALSGYMAANLAKEGFGASREVLTDPNGGLFTAYSNGGKPEAVLAGLGSDWELERISMRPWPVAVHLQPVVTGLMALIRQGIDADDIDQVRVQVSALAFQMHGTVAWTESFRARISAPFVTAVVLLDRRCWVEQFSAERIADPDVAAFARARVLIETDPAVQDGQAIVEIRLRDGTEHREHITASWGEPSNPLPRSEVVGKFRATAASVLPAGQADEALAMIAELEAVPDMAQLLSALRVLPG
jgi:2-methylcitrate dehydratase PrpD